MGAKFAKGLVKVAETLEQESLTSRRCTGAPANLSSTTNKHDMVPAFAAAHSAGLSSTRRSLVKTINEFIRGDLGVLAIPMRGTIKNLITMTQGLKIDAKGQSWRRPSSTSLKRHKVADFAVFQYHRRAGVTHHFASAGAIFPRAVSIIS